VIQHIFEIGADVRCTDGKAGTIGGLIINPNRSHVDYIIINPGLLGGREYYVPSSQIQQVSAQGLALPCTYAELQKLPREEVWTAQGTVQDNLQSLCIARHGMAVQDVDGSALGQLHGVAVDAALEVKGIKLEDAPDRVLLIERFTATGDTFDTLVVTLARAATA
jgi:hypothetical protein